MSEATHEEDVDRLYGLPLGEFTRERDALVRRLRSEGRREAADEVASLTKPVLAAWVVNQLARQRRADVRALVDAADAIRAGRPEADDRFRAAVDELVRAARELLVAEGRRPTDAVVRDIATTLRAVSAAQPELLVSGRLTQPVETTGFEVMAGAVPPARRRAHAPSRKKRAERARVDEARTALAAARDEARRLGREADEAERDARRLRADADAAERRVAQAEKRFARLQGG